MFDAIVVGARCGGASTALLLARRGHRVLVVDRTKFPSEVPSTSYIKARGVSSLAEWGLLDAVMATGCPPLPTMLHRAGTVDVSGTISAGRFALAPRRSALDAILVEAAAQAGAVFEDDCNLVDLDLDGPDGLVSVSLRLGGRIVREMCQLVIGADGMRSRVADLCGARPMRHDGRLTCVYYSQWLGLDRNFAFYERDGIWVSTIPTSDGVTMVASYLPQSQFPRARTAPSGIHHDCVRAVAPEVHMQMLAGTATARLIGRGDQFNFVRSAAGCRWALVGDANRHSDSITASGITNAFDQAALIVDCLDPDLQDESRLANGLREYTRRCDALLDERYDQALGVARLELPEWRLDFMSAVARRADYAAAYADYVSELISPDEFLSTIDTLA